MNYLIQVRPLTRRHRVKEGKDIIFLSNKFKISRGSYIHPLIYTFWRAYYSGGDLLKRAGPEVRSEIDLRGKVRIQPTERN